MSKRSKFANEPLLYIQQPIQGKPNAPMQHFYTTPKNSSSSSPNPETKKKTTQTPIKKRPTISPFQNSTVENPQEMKVSKQNSPEQEKAPIQSTKKRRTSLSSFHNDAVEPVQELQQTEVNSSQDIKEREDKKNFKDMNIQEKIDYFLNTSSHLPRMRCEVITVERKYRGIILGLEDNEVQMRVGRRTVFINQEDIKDIQLLGLGF